jgi:hypothetical protein
VIHYQDIELAKVALEAIDFVTVPANGPQPSHVAETYVRYHDFFVAHQGYDLILVW